MSAAAIASQLQAGTYDCAICHEFIISSSNGAFWNCGRCFTILHQACATQWAVALQEQQQSNYHEQQLQLRAAAAAASSSSSPLRRTPMNMTCPACRTAVTNFDPSSSSCYCRKTVLSASAKRDLLLLPGSCGERCEKKRCVDGVVVPAAAAVFFSAASSYFCPHSCPLMCHPGACPDCELTREQGCYCGKGEKKTVRCRDGGQSEHYSCGRPCSFIFPSCGCRCEKPCHDLCKGRGEKAEEGETYHHLRCGKSVQRVCRCGQETFTYPCGEQPDEGAVVTCKRRCTKLASCQFHRCMRECCSPDDGKCLSTPGNECPLAPAVLLSSSSSLLEQLCCDCGRTTMAKALQFAASASSSPETAHRSRRTSCRDPLPGCGTAPCGKHCSGGVRQAQDNNNNNNNNNVVLKQQQQQQQHAPQQHICQLPCHENRLPADPDCFAKLLLCFSSDNRSSSSSSSSSSSGHGNFCPPCSETVRMSCRCGNASIATYCFVRSMVIAQRNNNNVAASPNSGDRDNANVTGNDEEDDNIGRKRENNNSDGTALRNALISICEKHSLDSSAVPLSQNLTGRSMNNTVTIAPPFLLCSAPCRKPLNCGNSKHTCEEFCCPLTHGQHSCPRVCQKLLSCKIHKCLKPCHGNAQCNSAQQPCTQIVSFDPIYCHCGRSSIEPPIRCHGATPLVPACPHPCTRQRPCGHGAATAAAGVGVPHSCHSDAVGCPDCTVPVLPQCKSCGKKLAEFRIPCWRATKLTCSCQQQKMPPQK